MNTYVIPMCNGESAWIEKVVARSLSEARDKVIDTYVNMWDMEYPKDWKEFDEMLEADNVIIGDLVDIDSL